MATLPQFQHVGALPFLPPFLSWSVDLQGVVLSMFGPAEERFASKVQRVRGQHYSAAFAEDPEAIRLIERALAGEPLAETSLAWGARWWNEVHPQYDRSGLVGVVGVSIPAPPEAAEPPAEPDGVHSWLVTAPIRGEGQIWAPGDVIRDNGTTMLRASVVDRSAGLTLLRRHVAGLRYLLPPDASTPARRPADPAAAGAPTPALRLIR